MPDTRTELQAAQSSRQAPKGRRARRKWLRWIKMEPVETPEQKVEREAREAKEAREDFLVEFWNRLPESERLRMCEEGGIIWSALRAIQSPPMPKEIIRRSQLLGL